MHSSFKTFINFAVPERLRLLLRETESDYEGRTDLLPRDEEDRELNSRAALDSIKTEVSICEEFSFS